MRIATSYVLPECKIIVQMADRSFVSTALPTKGRASWKTQLRI